MRHRLTGTGQAMALFTGALLAAGSLKSGPQPGEEIPGPFHVKNVNGSQAGKSNCQV